MSDDVIFTPLRFRNLEVKNRVFRSNISGRFDNDDGSLTQTRINWECKFAKGGVGAIISSYVPVLIEGRIIANYATVHRDDFIPLWAKLAEAVRSFDCKYIMQLSHSGRQMDVPGVHNAHRPSLSSTSRKESLHGFLCQAMNRHQIELHIKAFAQGARRAKEAGIDGVELHAANGYLFSQFLSSGINDRKDEYGGSLHNRARFLLDVIEAIRAEVGRDYHLQVKLSAVDMNNVVPWEDKGNTLSDTVEVAKWCEAAGADALHISMGSLFPHPLNPPGDFHFETISATYDAMISSGVYGFRNYLLFRLPVLRPGGWQTASKVREAIDSGACDGVSLARSLVANPDLLEWWRKGEEQPPRPCTYCNRCLLNAPKNPMGCYEPLRFANHDEMVEELMTIFKTRPELRVPRPEEV